LSVFDASVVVDALVSIGPTGAAARVALRDQPRLEAPAVLAAEVASALRRMVLVGELAETRARVALGQLCSARVVQYPFEPFAARAWQLRDNLTVYNAWYAALAESLGVDLVTMDERLLAASGPTCDVRRP
jgi:predicted nucleic acid-binding protein